MIKSKSVNHYFNTCKTPLKINDLKFIQKIKKWWMINAKH